MTNGIIINFTSNTIEITKKFASAAKRYGTPEYESLQAARRDYPRYRVILKKTSRKAESFKGLTFDYMENYIRNHNPEQLVSFYTLCGKNSNGEKQEFAAARSYGEIKQWFLKQFPELCLDQDAINDILKNRVA